MTTNLNETFAAVQAASRELALLSDDIINQILNAVADATIAETAEKKLICTKGVPVHLRSI